MGNYITAVDFGTTKVAVAVGERSTVGVRITAYGEAPSRGILRGDVLNIKAVRNTLKSLVEDVEEQMKDRTADFKVSTLYAGIAGTNIRCELTSVKRTRADESSTIEQSEIEDMRTEAFLSFDNGQEKVLHVIPQSYNVDDLRDLPDIEGHQGKEIQGFYMVFIGKTNSAEHTISAVEKAGFKVGSIILEPVASAKAVLTEDETELGAALVDIGGGTSDLLIVKDNKIRYSAVIPFGGKSITSDISQICNVTERQAEVMKRKHGTCIAALGPDNRFIGIKDEHGIITKRVPYRVLDETIEARTGEIIATIKNEIIKSGYDKKISRLVLTGGTANLAQIGVLFKQMTGYNVRLAVPNEKYIIGNSCPEIFNPSSSTVAGLILKGFEIDAPDEGKEAEDDVIPGKNAVNEVISTTEAGSDDKKGGWRLFGRSRKEEPQPKPEPKEEKAEAAKQIPESRQPAGQPYRSQSPTKKTKKSIEDSLLGDIFSFGENDNDA